MKYYISLFIFFNFFSINPLSIIINHIPNSFIFLQKIIDNGHCDSLAACDQDQV